MAVRRKKVFRKAPEDLAQGPALMSRSLQRRTKCLREKRKEPSVTMGCRIAGGRGMMELKVNGEKIWGNDPHTRGTNFLRSFEKGNEVQLKGGMKISLRRKFPHRSCGGETIGG